MEQSQPVFPIYKLVYKAITRQPQNIDSFKPTSIFVEGFYPAKSTLNDFEDLFDDVEKLPTFVFNATFRLVLQCVAQSNIPSKLMGLIHINSDIKIHALQNWRLPSNIRVTLTEVESTKNGWLYSIKTEVFQNGINTITNINKMLDRSRAIPKGSSGSENQIEDTKKFMSSAALKTFTIKQSDVWKYAKTSGDFNPIHMSHFLARKFGLKHALVHGMHNAHLSLKTIIEELGYIPDNINIEFNKPCFYPTTTTLVELSDTDSFGLFSHSFKYQHMKVNIDSE